MREKLARNIASHKSEKSTSFRFFPDNLLNLNKNPILENEMVAKCPVCLAFLEISHDRYQLNTL
jgi:hypothetical protein